MSWIDLSFKELPGNVTKRAKPLGLTTQIVMKVPAWNIVVMRISGDAEAIRKFMLSRFDETWIVDMHMKALKDGDAPILDSYKDRQLKENRRAAA